MNILNNNKDRRTYKSPIIESIQLDNEISLQLESPAIPEDGDEVYNSPSYFNNDPFKTNIS